MAGLLDDPTKTNNPVATAVQAMSDKAFPTTTSVGSGKDSLSPSGVPTTIMSTGSHAEPQPAVGPVAPDQDHPLPLPTPSATPPAPAPVADLTVEQRLNGLLADNSDYIKRARQEGMNTANKRGLANSSIAAGASQGAAIDRALPIAQQDADIAATNTRLATSIQAEKDRLTQAAGYDMERLQADAANNLIRDAAQATSQQELARVQGTIQSALQSQGNTEQIQRMGIDLSNQLQLQDKQLQSDLSKIAASGDQDIRRLVEAGNQERVTLQQSIAAQDRQQMANAMVNIFQIEQQLRAALLSNDKISASERAAYERTITSLGQPIRDFMDRLFGTGGSSTGTPATGTVPPGTTPGTGTGGLVGGTGIDVGTTGTTGGGGVGTSGLPDQAPGNPSLPFIPIGQNGLLPPDQLAQLGLQ